MAKGEEPCTLMSRKPSLSLSFLHSDKHQVFTSVCFWTNQGALNPELLCPDGEKTTIITLQISCNHEQ